MSAMLTASLVLANLMAVQSAAGDGRAEVIRKLEGLRVTVDFDQTPINDAIDYLREVTGLNLIVLPKALEKEPDLKIRLKVKDLSVKSVLKLMLGSKGLAASYRDGAVVIMPKEDLNDGVTMKMIDVRSMLVRLQDSPGPKVELVSPNGPTLAGVTVTFEEPKPPVVDEEFMVQIVKENTGGGSWESNSKAAITLANGMLVISQTPGVIREVERLLQLLGQYR